MNQDEDRRGSDEIRRLMANFADVFEKETGAPLPILIREAHLLSALVNADAKGVEIGAEYARRESADT